MQHEQNPAQDVRTRCTRAEIGIRAAPAAAMAPSAAKLKAVDLDKQGIVAGGDSPYYCTLCRLALTCETQAKEHAVGRKHGRVMRHGSCGLVSESFDSALVRDGFFRVLALGDCHGGRSLCLFSSLVRSLFYGGSIYSWAVNKKRSLPPLKEVLQKSDVTRFRNEPDAKLVVVFSYGEIDCRCHAQETGQERGLQRLFILAIECQWTHLAFGTSRRDDEPSSFELKRVERERGMRP